MTEHENYYFDVCGYLVVHNALSHIEVDTFNRAFDAVVEDGSLPASAPYRYPFLQLRDHPVLRRYLSRNPRRGVLLRRRAGVDRRPWGGG